MWHRPLDGEWYEKTVEELLNKSETGKCRNMNKNIVHKSGNSKLVLKYQQLHQVAIHPKHHQKQSGQFINEQKEISSKKTKLLLNDRLFLTNKY